MSYMGLDVGQTGCKAVIFDENGNQRALSYREYETIVPREGWAELDSQGVKESCFVVMKEAQHQCLDTPVKGLAISTQGEAFTPIGQQGECLANAMITFDTRASHLAETWTKEYGIKKEEILSKFKTYNINGRPFFYPMSSMPAYSKYRQGKNMRKINPVSYEISPYGLSFPSFATITESDVDYVCDCFRKILLKKI